MYGVHKRHAIEVLISVSKKEVFVDVKQTTNQVNNQLEVRRILNFSEGRWRYGGLN